VKRRGTTGQDGQALLLVLGALLLVVLLALAAGALARGFGDRADRQRAADLAALAAARAMADDYAQVVVPVGDGPGEGGGLAGDPAPAVGALDRAAYLARATRAARGTAARNGAPRADVTFPGGAERLLPLQVTVTIGTVRARAEAVVPASGVLAGGAAAGQYAGPLAYRDGRPMRPDVALAYDRMRAAARRDGVSLVVVSGFRSDAEQAVLFARHPDPKWVAPPGHSLHRLGTELDLGPVAAYAWLARNAKRFGFRQRYSWEPWHFGMTRNAGSASVGYGGPRARSARAGDGEGDGAASGGVLPGWVPSRYRDAIIRAAQRWNVGAALLAAQLRVESGFDPQARSGAGALGIAQFMPGTARQYGLRNPFDADAAIDAQARLMRDLLRDFGSVPLALAAYNAGGGAVQRCRCAGPYPETRRYVAAILALLLGSGDPGGVAATQLTVRLVA